MNRKERRAVQSMQHKFVSTLPVALTPVPPEEFPKLKRLPDLAWRSRYYLVQLFHEGNAMFPALIRLSVCKTKLGMDGRWEDGIAWDELQAIKAELGYEAWYGVEVYPPADKVVNVANMRHLWLLPAPLPIGWL